MAKIDVLDVLRAKYRSPLEFNFDNLWIPPINAYLSQEDVKALREIATSIKLSSKIQVKYKMIDNIMKNRGFKRFSAGTNRVVYSFLEDDRFLVKIAVDKVGMQDNPLEYKNQFLLKPYVTKTFYTSECGTVGFVERVLPVKNKEEFREIASDVFDILVNKILGKYVVEDVGTKYFMNWGCRNFSNGGPVLLDYPYVYKLDGKKLFCTKILPSNEICNGEIDYDSGFNSLICTRCGKRYLASDLRDNSISNKIVIKGGDQMRVSLMKGNEILARSIGADSVITRPTKKNGNSKLVVRLESPYKKEDHPINNTDIEVTENSDHHDIVIEDNKDTDFVGSSNVESDTNLIIDEDEGLKDEIIHDENNQTSTLESNTNLIIDEDLKDEIIHDENNQTSTLESNTDSIKVYNDYDDEYDDDYTRREPIRKLPKRDSNGRFISTGGSSKPKSKPKNGQKSTYIPNKKN